LVRPKQPKRDTTFGTRNVRSLYRPGLFTTVAREFTRYKSEFLGEQEVMWDKGGTVKVRDNFFMVKETKIINSKKVCLYTTEQYHSYESKVC
jgi:hypothetical protein